MYFSNLDFAKSPEYNMGLIMNVDHKKKHSSAEVELKYGKNPKDQNKRIFWATSLNKKAFTKKNAVVNFQMEAKAPEHVRFMIYACFVLYLLFKSLTA